MAANSTPTNGSSKQSGTDLSCCVDFLTYQEAEDKFKLYGSFEELIKLTKAILQYENQGETFEDVSHNLMTFKTEDIILKWYTTTHSLVIQGAGHRRLKEKFADIYQSRNISDNNRNNNGGDVSPSPIEPRISQSPESSQSTTSTEKPPTTKEDICIGCQVLKPEIMSLRHEVNELRLIVSGKEIMQIRAESPHHTSNITLRDEITTLKAELLAEKEQNRATTQDLKSMIKSLEEERDSLLTATRLINSDRQQEPSSKSDQLPEDSEWRTQRKRGTRHSISQKPGPKDAAPNTNEINSKSGRKIIIAGDSMVRNIQGNKMSRTHQITTRSFPGSSIKDMVDYIKPIARAKPDEIVLHVGTNDLKSNNPRQVAEGIVDLVNSIISQCLETKVSISSLVHRNDSLDDKVTRFYTHFATKMSGNSLCTLILQAVTSKRTGYTYRP